MAKKQSLSDLLQQEAQKFTSPEDESVIEVSAQEIAPEEATTDEESSPPIAEPTTTRRTNPTKADLEATVNELTSNLEKSHQKEAALEQEIVDLKSKLSQQKTLVSEQKILAEQLTKELDETKKTALQLAEANSKLIEEINAFKQAAETKSQVVAKQTSAIKPVKENYNPLNYKKSHRSSEKLAERQTSINDDFAENTWLYD
jgi:chromosome segregation ATPase